MILEIEGGKGGERERNIKGREPHPWGGPDWGPTPWHRYGPQPGMESTALWSTMGWCSSQLSHLARTVLSLIRGKKTLNFLWRHNLISCYITTKSVCGCMWVCMYCLYFSLSFVDNLGVQYTKILQVKDKIFFRAKTRHTKFQTEEESFSIFERISMDF